MTASRRVAIVTGAASGLGLAIAERLASDGYAVTLADQNQAMLDLAVEQLAAWRENLLAQVVDVSLPAEVDSMVSRAVDRFGRLDAMVSNAGIGGVHHFLDQPFEHWNRVLAVNLTGVFLCGQAAGRVMAKQRSGRIINMASASGDRASSGRTAYGTSKAAVIQLTKQMALDLGDYGISVNAIAPGPVDTPMVAANHTQGTREAFVSRIPLSRYGVPGEIAAVAAFLASEQASYVNGQTIFVDGGLSAVGLIADDVAKLEG